MGNRYSDGDHTVDVRGRCRWVIRAAFGIALLWHPAVAAAPSEIGNAYVVRYVAYGTQPEQPRAELRVGEPVVNNEIIETTTNAALHIRFIDDTDFQLGPDSRATLDSFLYDPQSRNGQMALLLKEGIFRLKTGQMKASGMRVVTPVAIITLEGTEFMVRVRASGEVTVTVTSGAVTLTPLASASPVTIFAPDTAQVFQNGDVQVGNLSPLENEGIRLLVRLAALDTGELLDTAAGPTTVIRRDEDKDNGDDPGDDLGDDPGDDPGGDPGGPGGDPGDPGGPGGDPGGPGGDPGVGPGDPGVGPDGPGRAQKSRAGGLDGTNPGRGNSGPAVGENNPNASR